MLPVTQDFENAINASSRKIVAKVDVSFSDPYNDPTFKVTESENAYISQPQQAIIISIDQNNNGLPTHKWASLDGNWVLDGTWCLAPDNPTDALHNHMGWWGSQLSGADGSFASPYPTLTTQFSARAILSLSVFGDSMRGEYPVDFKIYAYAGTQLIYTETVTGNNLMQWQKTYNVGVMQGITSLALEVHKWNMPSQQAKISAFISVLMMEYTGSDIFQMNLLQEREYSTDGSLPIGNIASGQLTLQLNNVYHYFDAGNQNSPLYGLVKANRKIKPYIGVLKVDGSTEWVQLGTYFSDEWEVPDDDIIAETTALDRLNLLTLQVFNAPVYQNIDAATLIKNILDPTGFNYFVDPALSSYIIPYAWFDQNITKREALRQIAEATISECFVDLNDIIQFQGPTYVQNQTQSVKTITRSQYSKNSNPNNFGQLKNYINVPVSPLMLGTPAGTMTAALATGTAGTSIVNLTSVTPANGTLVNGQQIQINSNTYTVIGNFTASGGVCNGVTISPALSATCTNSAVTFSFVYQSSSPIAISVGQTLTTTVTYQNKPVINASASITGGPAGLVITNVNYYAWGADVTVNGATTNGTFTITVTGTPLVDAGATNITASDSASIYLNGQQIYTFETNQLIQTVALAQNIANTCLAFYKDPRRDLELDWQGDPALQLGDRITVPDSQTTTADFYIVSNELDFDGGLSMITKGKRVIA